MKKKKQNKTEAESNSDVKARREKMHSVTGCNFRTFWKDHFGRGHSKLHREQEMSQRTFCWLWRMP